MMWHKMNEEEKEEDTRRPTKWQMAAAAVGMAQKEMARNYSFFCCGGGRLAFLSFLCVDFLLPILGQRCGGGNNLGLNGDMPKTDAQKEAIG
jgi:hypothetical protein